MKSSHNMLPLHAIFYMHSRSRQNPRFKLGTSVLRIVYWKMTRDVAGFLAEQQRKATGDLAQEWSNIEELYNKK